MTSIVDNQQSSFTVQYMLMELRRGSLANGDQTLNSYTASLLKVKKKAPLLNISDINEKLHSARVATRGSRSLSSYHSCLWQSLSNFSLAWHFNLETDSDVIELTTLKVLILFPANWNIYVMVREGSLHKGYDLLLRSIHLPVPFYF